MRIQLLLGLGWLAGACGGSAAIESTSTSAGNAQGAAAGAASSTGECRALANTVDAGSAACSVARALVECASSDPTSGSCECLSDDPTTCAFCRQQLTGEVTCVSKCAANEYAVACGGPPIINGDGTSSQGPVSAPPGCGDLGYTPAGSEFACCPCQ